MDKKRNSYLIGLADEKLKNSKMFSNNEIAKIYDGKTAALSVSFAMSGLLPTLAFYYQEDKKKEEPYLRNILDVVAQMIDNPDNNNSKFKDAGSLFGYAIKLEEEMKKSNDETEKKECDEKLKDLKQSLIECAIALKQVVRTYNLV